MTPSINAVGFTLKESQSEMIETKLKRISYADDLIIDLLLKIKHEKIFSFGATCTFQWGSSATVSTENEDFAAGLNILIDMLDAKVTKEKEKVQNR